MRGSGVFSQRQATRAARKWSRNTLHHIFERKNANACKRTQLIYFFSAEVKEVLFVLLLELNAKLRLKIDYPENLLNQMILNYLLQTQEIN